MSQKEKANTWEAMITWQKEMNKESRKRCSHRHQQKMRY